MRPGERIDVGHFHFGDLLFQAADFGVLRHRDGLGLLKGVVQGGEFGRLLLQVPRVGPQEEVDGKQQRDGQERGGCDGDLPIAAGLGQRGNLQGIPAIGTLDDESGTALVDFEVVAAFRTIKVDQRHACLLSCAGKSPCNTPAI